MDKKDIETVRNLLEVMNDLSFENTPVPKAVTAVHKLQAVAKLLHKWDNPTKEEAVVEQVKESSKKPKPRSRKKKPAPEKEGK